MLLRTPFLIRLMMVGLLAGAACLTVAPAMAQVVGGARVYGPVGVGAGVNRYGWGRNWGWVNGYSGYSPAQDAASLVSAAGQYREEVSRAEVNMAQADAQYIENVKAWNKFYNDRRDAYQAKKAAESEKEQVAVQHYIANRKSQKPPRLTSAQLDGYAGVIHWPTALQRVEYTTRRMHLENLFATRASTGSNPEMADAIRGAARAMQAELRDRIHEYDTNPNEYLTARKFLESLALEGEYSVE